MMSNNKSGITVRGLAPLLQVFDMPASLHFYRDLLGFELTATSVGSQYQGDKVDWAMLQLGTTQLMLNTLYEEDQRPPAPDPARNDAHRDTTVYFGCPDVDAAYEFMISKGIQLDKPHITHYGFKEIHFSDPDGYGLVFHWPANPSGD